MPGFLEIFLNVRMCFLNVIHAGKTRQRGLNKVNGCCVSFSVHLEDICFVLVPELWRLHFFPRNLSSSEDFRYSD